MNNTPQNARTYSIREEILNSGSHGAGILMAAVGLIWLIVKAAPHGALELFGVILYSLSMILLYSASTLYHAVQNEEKKRVCQKLDHCAIYLLIAGTYTPLMLSGVQTKFGYGILIAEWIMAVIALILNLTMLQKAKYPLLALSLIMGWLCMAVVPALYRNMPFWGFWLLVSGGVAYTLGVGFYVWKGKEFTHAVWHLFVLAGSILQFFSVLSLF